MTKIPAQVSLRTRKDCVIESFGYKLVDIEFPDETSKGLKFVTTEPIQNPKIPFPLEIPWTSQQL